MKSYILLLFAVIPFFTNAQLINGTVLGQDGSEEQPLPGVNIFWEGTSEGTASKPDGSFKIKQKGDQHNLVFSFVGYEKRIVEVNGSDTIEVRLSQNMEIEEVTVVKKNRGTYLSAINPIQTESIGGAELHKAACCNLAESFETNPSVDVSYSDAVTGAKQIKLLGLDGTYSILQVENMPNLRGLATTFGLTYIPGPWLESIQVSKGAASVLNGYESIAGQINAELKKPDDTEKLFLNAYANAHGKWELNGNGNIRLSNKVTTAVFAHVTDFTNQVDDNGDNFMDEPLMRNYQLSSRWKYNNHKGFMAQWYLNYLNEDRLGGQMGAERDMEPTVDNPYGVSIKTDRVEGFFKTGYVWPGGKTAIAWLSNFARHETDSYYGLSPYDADETRLYARVVLTTDLDPAATHSLNSGASFVYDDINEILYSQNIQRTEKVPGIFSEYTFKPNSNFTLMAGIRADFHNDFGAFVTPRMHLRYNFANHFTIRTSAGKGYRTANVLSENTFMLANARPLSWSDDAVQEEAWNYGFAFVQNYELFDRDLTINAEFFRTDFQSSLLVDRESSATYILLNESTGKAYANSLQLDVRWQPIERLDLLLAYRKNDIKQTINGQLKDKPLTNDYKALINLNYTTNMKKWMFDYTLQFNGGGRIPLTPESLSTEDRFGAYTVMNAQVTKYFRYWNIYAGVENLTNFKQDNPIEGADNPFGSEFNATNVWGPVMGRKIYVGLRFKLDYD